MPNYVYFLLAVAGLIVGYIIYGSIVAKIFGADENRPTPAKTMADGVDYVEMPMWKVWLIQLLNIAGVGPVFGPILGALYGPSALLWIVIGTIFAGAVHDYFSGMLSVRYKGANVPTIVGYNLGNVAKQVMRVFAVILLLLVGVGIRYSVLPEIDTDSQNSESGADDTPGRRSLFDFPYLWLGALAIFCQVGAQVVAIDTIINYAGSMGMDLVESKVFPSFTLTCTMIGFLSGIVLIPRYVTQKQALVVCSTLGLLLSLGVVLCDFGVTLFGHRANASIFLLNALGLPNALIYAGVWPLAIRGLGRFTKMGSSLLIMGLCGNAILPLVYGFVAERCGMRMGYWVLVPCFLYLVFFAVKGYKIVRWPWQRIENNG